MAAVIWCRLLCCSFTEPASQGRKERFWWRKLRICFFCCDSDLFWALTSHKLRVVLIGEWSVSGILSPVFCFVFYFNNFNSHFRAKSYSCHGCQKSRHSLSAVLNLHHQQGSCQDPHPCLWHWGKIQRCPLLCCQQEEGSRHCGEWLGMNLNL